MSKLIKTPEKSNKESFQDCTKKIKKGVPIKKVIRFVILT